MPRVYFRDLNPPASLCKCCGQCCSALYVKKNRAEIKLQAIKDEALGLTMLESDAIFLHRHGIPLTSAEAELLSPGIALSPNWPHEEYWTCEFLVDGKKCRLNLENKPKPRMCSGYPWYGERDHTVSFLFPGCGYRQEPAGKKKQPAAFSVKERLPLATIETARAILAKLDISTDIAWYNNMDRLYSCRITVSGSNIGTNGKGTSQDLALASALGEFMERIQNQIMFQGEAYNLEMDPEKPFLEEPMEIILSGNQLPSFPDAFRKHPGDDPSLSLYELWESGRKILAAHDSSVCFVPFYNLRNDDLCYLPHFLVSHVYGSNGMCAGNTAEEAIVQGLSEIMERYAAGQIYFRELTPPTIPRDYIRKQAPESYNLVKFLEKNSHLKITVKDCSLGQGLPVVGIIAYYQPLDHNFFFLGADPNFEIALERCLTEFCQGKDLARGIFGRFSPVSPKSRDSVDPYNNFRMFLNNGSGLFPEALYQRLPSYQFQPYRPTGGWTQKERLRFLLDWLEQGEYSLFARDVSFLGFNAYLLVVPGLSECYYNEKEMDFTQYAINRMKYLSRLHLADDRELQELRVDMEYYLGQQRPENLCLLRDYAGHRLLGMDKWLNSLQAILSLVCYRLGDYDAACDHYQGYVATMLSTFSADELRSRLDIDHFCATSDFLNRKAGRKHPDRLPAFPNAGPVDETVANRVQRFYELVESDFGQVIQYIMGDEMPSCWDCASCQLKSACCYEDIVQIIGRLRNRRQENVIDQKRLREVLKET